ncbi:MAG: DUF1566 domain-containing protein [Acidiferrobacterales bacterium]
MDSQSNKKRRAFIVAGVVSAFLVVVLLFGIGSQSAPTLDLGAAMEPTSTAPSKKAYLAKRSAKKRTSVNSTRVMPVTQPVNLIVSFPKPTDNTIVVSRAPKYVKIGHADGELHESASTWDCVEDKSSGLIWERKTQDRGLRDAGNFYSWYDPNELSNGGHVGAADNGKCRGGINCDTDAYVKAINALKLCGFSDWRLPTRADLMSLVQYGEKGKGLINRHFFPTATSDWYWAMDSDNLNPSRAWYVLFFNGRYMKASKSEAKRIRLVRTRSERSMRNMAKKSETIAAKLEAIVANKPAGQRDASGS